MMSDPVPAITETAATGEIAEIFADIRGVLGVEVVNLIWRHLAPIPRALYRRHDHGRGGNAALRSPINRYSDLQLR
jgi:hypothetical protein